MDYTSIGITITYEGRLLLDTNGTTAEDSLRRTRTFNGDEVRPIGKQYASFRSLPGETSSLEFTAVHKLPCGAAAYAAELELQEWLNTVPKVGQLEVVPNGVFEARLESVETQVRFNRLLVSYRFVYGAPVA